MKPQIIVFGASNSQNSINKALASYAASCIPSIDYRVIDLNDYEMPIYSIDKNMVSIPQQAHDFNKVLENCQGIIIGVSEHNGTFTTAFKNIFDWTSRLDKQVFKNKPMLLLSTSPGPRGASGALEAAKTIFPFFGGNIQGVFSLPNFTTNLVNNKLVNEELNNTFLSELNKFTKAITAHSI